MATIEVTRGRAGMERALTEIGRRIDDEVRLARVRKPPTKADELLEAEQAHIKEGRLLADLFIAEEIVSAHLDTQLLGDCCREVRERILAGGACKVEDGGWQAVRVTLPGGTILRLYTRYLWPSRKGKPGRPRGNGKRGPKGVGSYPVIERLGIRDSVSPATRSEISRQVVLCSSYEEAREQLDRSGLSLDLSTLVRVAVEMGKMAVERRNKAFEAAIAAPLLVMAAVAGLRVRISLDGGRARTRTTRRGRGIRPGKNHRRPFSLKWREPRVITIDVLDEKGGTDRTWQPIYEVTLGDADETFAVLLGLLRLIGVHLAADVLFVADGAEWIWNRVRKVLADAGVPPERVYLVLDYYHATEHIAEALRCCKGLSAKDREAQLRKQRDLLLQPGGPAQVVDQLRGLARGRRARAVNKEADYLEGHLDHMQYAKLRSMALPIGSGIVESAVRRLVNLRFKSASMCWRADHLLPLLYLRAILKAGKWDAFVLASLDGRHWLEPGLAKQTPHEEAPRKAA